MAAPAPNGFQYAVETVGPAGWVIVALLGLVSVVAWSLLATRWTVLRKARRGNADYLEAYRQTRRPLELHTRGLEMTGTPMFSVYTAGSRELCLQIFGTSEKDESFPVRLQNAGRIAPTQMQPVVAAMGRAVREMALRLEEGAPLLAACVVTAPALGLLGAVWGIMDTFARVAPAQGNPALQEVAPGIAGALAIAALGLVAGIPALFGHHYLARAFRTMVRQLDQHAAELGAAIERHHVTHGLPADRPPGLAAHAPHLPVAGQPSAPPPPGTAGSPDGARPDAAPRARRPGPMFPGQPQLPLRDEPPDTIATLAGQDSPTTPPPPPRSSS